MLDPLALGGLGGLDGETSVELLEQTWAGITYILSGDARVEMASRKRNNFQINLYSPGASHPWLVVSCEQIAFWRFNYLIYGKRPVKAE